jgi:hypothetical protein
MSRKKLSFRWLIRIGMCLVIGALVEPYLADMLPVEGWDRIFQPSKPVFFRVVPGASDDGYVRMTLVGLGCLLICGGILGARKSK